MFCVDMCFFWGCTIGAAMKKTEPLPVPGSFFCRAFSVWLASLAFFTFFLYLVRLFYLPINESCMFGAPLEGWGSFFARTVLSFVARTLDIAVSIGGQLALTWLVLYFVSLFIMYKIGKKTMFAITVASLAIQLLLPAAISLFTGGSVNVPGPATFVFCAYLSKRVFLDDVSDGQCSCRDYLKAVLFHPFLRWYIAALFCVFAAASYLYCQKVILP